MFEAKHHKNILEDNGRQDARTSPFISLIMPVRNEAAFIERSLRAVLRQDYPSEKMEVIIVDGMSDDGTREIIARIGNQKNTPRTFMLENPFQIVSTALNIGLKHVKGDIVIRIDGHCEVASDYVRRCVEALEQAGADCVGGLQRPLSQGVIGKTIAAATTSAFGIGNAVFRYRQEAGWVDTVYLGAYRKEVFDRIGMFDEELVRNQDDEFNFRLLQAGGKIWLDPSIHSHYHPRTTLAGLRKQYFQYGFWKVRVFQKRGAVASLRHIVPSLFVLGIASSLALSLFARQPLFFLGLVGTYGIVNLFFSIIAAKRDWRAAALLPFAFFIIHFFYGLGFLYGLYKWRRHGLKFLLPIWRRTK